MIQMKKIAVLLSFVLAAGVAYAQDAAKTAAPAKASEYSAVKTHEMTAEVVSIDAMKNTITVKGELGNKTAPVEGKALATLKNVKPGEKVTLICRDNEKGEHQAVTEIKPAAKAPATN